MSNQKGLIADQKKKFLKKININRSHEKDEKRRSKNKKLAVKQSIKGKIY